MPYKLQRDRYSERAKKEGFAARSVYKLEEIDRRVRLFRQGQSVLDLGASPGSWVQYIAPKVGGRGRVVAVDISPMRIALPANVTAIVLNVIDSPIEEFTKLGQFDVVVSDMMAHTTGIRDTDVANSNELVDRATVIAGAVLKPGGKMLAKIFQGDGFVEVRGRMRALFDTVRIIKPDASKNESTEIYLVGIDRKPV